MHLAASRVLPVVLVLMALPLPRARAESSQERADSEVQAFAQTTSPDGTVRLAATTSLARIGTVAARDRLMLMAHADVDPRVRASAVKLLGNTRDPGVGHLLRAIATRDPDPFVRGQALEAEAKVEASTRSPRRAAAFSLICPGCGYFYLRQPARAAGYLGTTAALRRRQPGPGQRRKNHRGAGRARSQPPPHHRAARLALADRRPEPVVLRRLRQLPGRAAAAPATRATPTRSAGRS